MGVPGGGRGTVGRVRLALDTTLGSRPDVRHLPADRWARVQRDAHISGLRGDTINAALLGLGAVVSEDSVRRNLGKLDEAERAPGCKTTWTPAWPLCLACPGCSIPARLTRHGGQTRLTISHPHAEAAWVEAVCRTIADVFSTLRRAAEQLTPLQCWYRLLSRALVNGQRIDLHRPHPHKEALKYRVKAVREFLIHAGVTP